jgi:hypothetical protein
MPTTFRQGLGVGKLSLMTRTRTYDVIANLILLVVLFEGLLPFVAKLIGVDPVISVPDNLDAPEWWLVSALVIAGGGVLLETIDRAKGRAMSKGAQ